VYDSEEQASAVIFKSQNADDEGRDRFLDEIIPSTQHGNNIK